LFKSTEEKEKLTYAHRNIEIIELISVSTNCFWQFHQDMFQYSIEIRFSLLINLVWINYFWKTIGYLKPTESLIVKYM